MPPRLLGLLVGGPCVLVVALAVWLTPDARGYDTHTQLALPPCGFLRTTGLPCPTCGMTTAYANLAHGRVVSALRANVGGAALFVVTVLAGLVGLAQLVTGRAWLERLTPRVGWLWLALWAVLGGWALNLALGLAMGRWPAR